MWMVLIRALDVEHLWVGCCEESCSLLCLQADASHKASSPRLTSSTHARRAPPSPPHAYFLWNPKDDLHTTFQSNFKELFTPTFWHLDLLDMFMREVVNKSFFWDGSVQLISWFRSQAWGQLHKLCYHYVMNWFDQLAVMPGSHYRIFSPI